MKHSLVVGLAAFAALSLVAVACSAGSGGRRVTGRPGDDGGGGSLPDARAEGGEPPATTDVCGNGLDDDRNGLVDEGCPCTVGERQACWPGPPRRRGVGACRDGFQVCENFGEFNSWGECEDAVLPSAEIEGNAIDEDCDGVATGGPTCSPSEFGEVCDDGMDNTCDGLVDCDDPACASFPGCRSGCTPSEFGEDCSDGRDNDCDGQVDCVDPDCASVAACTSEPPPPSCTREFPFVAEIRCGDGRDNDCDGRVDCDDSDCRQPGQCGCAPRETACSDGMDEDCDGNTDCADTDCQRCTPGTFRWCDEPAECLWGKQECQSDGTWGPCVEASDTPAGCGGSFYSRDCCVSAGECCQNYPEDDASVGSCSGIVECR